MTAMRQRLFFLLLAWVILLPAAGGVFIPKDSAWRYFKGFSEASAPDFTAWRQVDFDDDAWASGQAAFYYERNPGSATAYTGHTELADMYGNYTCVFLRGTFVVSNTADLAALQIAALSDDGFIAWINGHEVGRFNMPGGEVPYNGVSLPALGEPIPWWTNTVTDLDSFLLPGTNVLAVQAFNCNLGSSSDFTINPALYFTPNLTGPTVTLLYPAAGAVVRQLNAIEVAFDKPVTGVDAGDLLINGAAATNLTVITPAQFIFSFPQPPTGVVQVAWSPTHGIHDASSYSNAFGGGSWSYTLNPNAPLVDVTISEFMAANSGKQTNSLHDELGNSPDWIELYNGTSAAVSLTSWSLTVDPGRGAKWIFPPVMIPAKSWLVVFASGRDTNVAGQLHTDFKLSASSGYLALLDAADNVISAFSPTYPQQYTDISYGRDRLDPTLLGYFTNATPGAANATGGTGFGPKVQFSRASGTFLADFLLELSTGDTNSDIRYVLVSTNLAYGTPAITNIPTATSSLYMSPIPITGTVQVRARAFPRQAGLWPGAPHTESYIKITAAAAQFTSDRPVILLHNLAGGALSASASPQNQNVIVMSFEPVNGRTSLTNPPTLVARGGFNIRGSSTAGLPQYNLALELWDEYNQDYPMEFLGLPAESDWVLYAQDGYDPSYLHNPLIHQLSRDAGRYSSRTRFAEMFLNTAGGSVTYAAPVGGNYFGLYTVEEKIKRGHDRVDVQKLEPQVTTAPLVSGGYMLKIDRQDSGEASFYDSYLQGSIVFVDPPGAEMVGSSRQAQYNYITGYFSQFGAALWGPNYTDPVAGYAAYIDVDSWVDHHILNALTFNVDALRLSGYFYKDRDKKIEMGPLWDFDRSMGTSYGGDVRCFNPRLWRVQASGDQGTDYFGNPSLLGVRWWQQLFTDPDFWQRWIDRWTDLRRGVFSTNHMFTVMDGLSSQLSAAQSREAARWSYTAPRSGVVSANGYSYSFSGSFAGEQAFLKRWLVDRINFIDTNFLAAPTFSSMGGVITPGFQLTLTAPTLEPGTTIYYTLDGNDPRLPGGGLSPMALAAASPVKLTLNANVRVFARDFNPAHSNPTGGAVGGNPPLSSAWSGPTVATFMVGIPALAITEIMYHPAPAGTNDGDNYEFIELKNVGSQALDLVGIRFTNGIDFTFTATNDITTLEPGQYLVLVKNLAAFRARYPAVTNIGGQYGGSLDNGGERLYLEGAFREPILDFSYNDAWYPTTDGQGFSLVVRNDYAPFYTWTNPASWRTSTAVHGSPGCADPASVAIPQVFVNEALTHTDPPEMDSVELYNPTASAAPIGGWFLTDDHTKPMKYLIPTNAVVPPGGYLVFDENQFNAGGSNSFAFSSLGEEVYLFSGDGTNLTGYRHGFSFGPQANGVTFGRHVTSDGREHFVTQQSNSLWMANAGPKVGPVVINELFYSPPPFGLSADYLDEFVELRNVTPQTVPLFDPDHSTNAWLLDGGVQFTFPLGVSLAPWSFLLVVGFDPVHDPVLLNWFRIRYNVDSNTPIYGPFQGHLSGGGERVALYLPDKPEIPPSPIAGYVPYVLAEEVHYSSLPPWPAGTDGTGNSLQRIASLAFGDEPLNWSAGPPSPGRVNAGSAAVDTDLDGLPDEWEIANGLDPRDPLSINGAQSDPDGDGQTNWQEYLAGTSPTNGLDYLRFDSVRVSGGYAVLQFNARPGRLYTIERCDSPEPGTTWLTLQDNLAGTGNLTWFDPLQSAARFYRLRVRLAP